MPWMICQQSMEAGVDAIGRFRWLALYHVTGASHAWSKLWGTALGGEKSLKALPDPGWWCSPRRPPKRTMPRDPDEAAAEGEVSARVAGRALGASVDSSEKWDGKGINLAGVL